VREATDDRGRDEHREVADLLGDGHRKVEGDGDVDVGRAVWAVLLDAPHGHDHDRAPFEGRL
jgi:hypothetical protein